MAQFTERLFTDADLDVSYEYIWVHNLNTANIILAWFDENNIDRTTTDTFQVIDITSIKISCGGPITGTNRITGVYDNSVNITGKKLFGFTPTAIDPGDELIYRVALGADGYATKNLLFSDFASEVATLVGTDVFLIDNLFSEFSTKTDAEKRTARNYIQAAGATETNTSLGTKVNKIGAVAEINAAGGVTNTGSAGTNIPSKAYVDLVVSNSEVQKEKLTLDQTPSYQDNELTVTSSVCYKYGNVWTLFINFTNYGTNSNDYYKLGRIPGLLTTAGTRKGPIAMENVTNNESGIYSVSNEQILVKLGKDDQDWSFTTTIIL